MMKKSTFILAVLIGIVLITAPASYAAVLYETDFESFATGSIDGQGGWVVITTNGEISTDSSYVIGGSKSLIVYYGSGNAEVTKSFTASAVVNVEFDTGDCATNKNGRFRIEDGSGNLAAQVNFSTNGQISAYNGTTIVDLMAYEDYDTNERSYNFRIVADTVSQTYDFYVDDVLMADGYDFYGSTGSQLSELSIKRYTSSKLIVDNLIITDGVQLTSTLVFIDSNTPLGGIATVAEQIGEVKELGDTISSTGIEIYAGPNDNPHIIPLIAEAGLTVDPAWVGNQGFYIKSFDPNRILITATTDVGVLYGLMELRDRVLSEGEEVLNQTFDVADRPVFPVRKGVIERRANFDLFWASEKITTPIFRYDDNPEIFNDVNSTFKADYLADVEANRDNLRDDIDSGADYGVKVYVSTYQPSMPEFGIDAFIAEHPECAPTRQTKEWHPAICPSQQASKDMLYDKVRELFEDVDDLGGMVLCMGEGWQSVYSCGCGSCGDENSVTLYRARLIEYIELIRKAMLEARGYDPNYSYPDDPDAPKVYLRPWQIVKHGLGDNPDNFISLPDYLPSDVRYYLKITTPPGSDYLWNDYFSPYINMPNMVTFGWNICHPQTTEPCMAQLCYTAQKIKNRAMKLVDLGSVMGAPSIYDPSSDILFEPGHLASQKLGWDPCSFDPNEYLLNWATEKFGASAGSDVADALEDTYKITDALVTLYPLNTHWFHMLNFDRNNVVHCWSRANDITQTSEVKDVNVSTLSSILSDFDITQARGIATNAEQKLFQARATLPADSNVRRLWIMAHATEGLTNFYSNYHYALVYNNLYENTGIQSYCAIAKTYISNAIPDMETYVNDMYQLYPEIDENFNDIDNSFRVGTTSPKNIAYIFGQMSSLQQQCQNGYSRLVMEGTRASNYSNLEWEVQNADPEIGYRRYSPYPEEDDWENIYNGLMTKWQGTSYTTNADNQEALPAIISPWILPTLYVDFTANISNGGMLVIKFVPLGGKNRTNGSIIRRSIQKIYIDGTYVKTLTDIGTDDTREDGDYTRYVELPATGTGVQSHQLKIMSKPNSQAECLGTEFYFMKLYTPAKCGDFGYPPGDINEDCYTDMDDLAMMASEWLDGTDIGDLAIMASGWLDCTDPDDERCGSN